jgi:hypothetical protein
MEVRMKSTMAARIRALQEMTVPELRAKYRDVFEEEPRSRHKESLWKQIVRVASSPAGAQTSAIDCWLKERRPIDHSSFCSIRIVPTSRRTGAWFGKMPTTSVRLATSPFRRSIGWGRGKLPPVLLWERHVRDPILGRVLQQQRGSRGLFSQRGEDLRRLLARRARIGLEEDRAHERGYRSLRGFWDDREQVPHEVHAVALPRGADADLANRLLEPAVRVADHELHDRGERLLGPSPRFQEAGHVASASQPRNLEVDRPEACLPRAIARAVALVRALGPPLLALRSGPPLDLEVHDLVREHAQRLAQEVPALLTKHLVNQPLERDTAVVVGHGVTVSSSAFRARDLEHTMVGNSNPACVAAAW